MLSDHTAPVEDGMRVRHDALARFTVSSGSTVLEDSLTAVDALGGAMTVAGVVYNRLAYSGGVSWWNPATGEAIKRPKVNMRVRPQDVLGDGEECGCSRCQPTEGGSHGRH